MATGGYEPSREAMAAIVKAAHELYRTARRWQAYSRLPGYPIERGNAAALDRLFCLERALNPRCLPWDRPTRKTPTVACWPPEAAEGLAWVRNLVDLILERNRLQALATAADATSLAGKSPAPEVISIQQDEVKALRIILALLPRPAKLPSALPAPPARAPMQSGAATFAEALDGVMERIVLPVQLAGPDSRPLVLGRPKPRLTHPQRLVIQALVRAGNLGLAKADLEKLCGDAINVLKRLAGSDEDWGLVIKLAGKKGNRYRISPPTQEVAHHGVEAGATGAQVASPDAHSPVW